MMILSQKILISTFILTIVIVISSYFYYEWLKYSFSTFYATALSFHNQITNSDVSPAREYSQSVINEVKSLRDETFDYNGTYLIPFARAAAHYLTAPQYGIAMCLLEKNFYTKLQVTLCYLYDTETFLASGRTVDYGRPDRFCAGKNEYVNSAWLDSRMPDSFDTIFITRDPLQRFISGFVNKCVDEKVHCFGCPPGDILCTVERLYEVLTILSGNYSDVTEMLDIPFTRYPRSDVYELTHFTPQSWHCDLLDRADKFTFIKFGEDVLAQKEMIDRVLHIYKKKNVEDYKFQIIKESYELKTKHSTRESPKRKVYENILRQSSEHMEMFGKIYYYDYVIFGFHKEWFSLGL